jgi:hypothetical protein
MSDVNDTPEQPASQGEDPIKNLKAEFTRKLDNVVSELSEQRKLNEQLLATLNTTTSSQSKERDPDMSTLLYQDPARYAQIMEERAEKRIMGKLERQQQVQAKQQSTIQRIVQDYPEAADSDHPLTRRAVEIYNTLADDEKSSPAAYRAAVAEAAAELGIKPKAKRPVSDDEPTLSSSHSSSPRRTKKASVDPLTLAFAEQMGLNAGDPELIKRLADRSTRNWNKFEKVKR